MKKQTRFAHAPSYISDIDKTSESQTTSTSPISPTHSRNYSSLSDFPENSGDRVEHRSSSARVSSEPQSFQNRIFLTDRDDNLLKLSFFTEKKKRIRVRRFRKSRILGVLMLLILAVSMASMVIGFILIDKYQINTQATEQSVSTDVFACDIGTLSVDVCEEQSRSKLTATLAANVNRTWFEYFVVVLALFLGASTYFFFKMRREIKKFKILQSIPGRALDFLILPSEVITTKPTSKTEASRSSSNAASVNKEQAAGTGPSSRPASDAYANDAVPVNKYVYNNSSKNSTIQSSSFSVHYYESMILSIQDEFSRVYILNRLTEKLPETWGGLSGDPCWGRLHKLKHSDRLSKVIRRPRNNCLDSSGTCVHFQRVIRASWKVFLEANHSIYPKRDQMPVSQKSHPTNCSYETVLEIITAVQKVVKDSKKTDDRQWLWQTYLEHYKQARFSTKRVLQQEYEEFLTNFNTLCSMLDVLAPQAAPAPMSSLPAEEIQPR